MDKSTVIQRVKEIMVFYKFNEKSFSKRLKIANTTLSSIFKSGKDVKSSFLETIYYEFPELDPIWLFTGKGKMFSDKPQFFNDTGSEATYNVKKPPDRPPCEESEKALLSKDEQVSMLILQSEKLINIIDRHSITIQNLSIPKTAEESPKEQMIVGGNVPKNVPG